MSNESGHTSHATQRENDIQGQRQVNDFFRLFYLSSDSPCTGDNNIGASIRMIGQPLQGAASAVMGGILSAFDTALTILNEDFDDPAESMISTATSGDDGDDESASEPTNELESTGGKNSGHHVSSNTSVLGCCRQMSRTKAAMVFRNSSDVPSANDTKLGQSTTKSSVELMGDSFQDDNPISLQNSTITNMWVHEYETGNFMPESRDNAATSSQDLQNLDTPSLSGIVEGGSNEKQNTDKIESNIRDGSDDSAYCFVRNENETSDGWLVVNDD